MKAPKIVLAYAVFLALFGFAYADTAYNHTLGETRGTGVMHAKGQGADDSTINTNVAGALAEDPILAHFKIYSHVNKEVVVLAGTVDTEQDVAYAVKIVESIKGVKRVDTRHLHVKNHDRAVKS